MHMPFPSHRDGDIYPSRGVMPATRGTESLFPPEEKDAEPEVLPEAVVSEYSPRLSICSYAISSSRNFYLGKPQAFK